MRKEKVHSRSVTYGVPASEDCENASVVYNLIEQELSGSFSMGRIATDNIALCESLSQAAAK